MILIHLETVYLHTHTHNSLIKQKQTFIDKEIIITSKITISSYAYLKKIYFMHILQYRHRWNDFVSILHNTDRVVFIIACHILFETGNK